MLKGPSQDSCQDLCLGGWGVLLALPKPLRGNVVSSSLPFPPGPQARLGAWPLVCWQDWGGGGTEATSNCPGKTSSLLTSLLSRRRGKRPERAHPMPGSYPSACPHLPPPPSSSALGQNRHRPQAWWQGSLNSQEGQAAEQAGGRKPQSRPRGFYQRAVPLPGAHSLPILGPWP